MSLRIRIVGVGEVGTTVARAAVQSGIQVELVETSASRRAELQRLPDLQSSVVLDAPSTAPQDATLLCVPSRGAGENFDPTPLLSAITAVGPVLAEGELLAVESTVPPFTTAALLRPAVERCSGRVAGRGIHLVHVPERVDSTVNRAYRHVARVIGGITPECTRAGVAIYRHLVDNIRPVEDATVAEWSKVLENAFRFVNVALINEFAMAALTAGIDPRAVVEAASSKPFGYMPFWPSSGIGGECVPSAMRFHLDALKRCGVTPVLASAAIDSDARLPASIRSVLNLSSGSRVLILGVGYKSGSTRLAASPGLRLARYLRARQIDVTLCDSARPPVRGITVVNDPSKLGDSYDYVIVCARNALVDMVLVRLAHCKLVDLSGSAPRGSPADSHQP